MPERARPKGKAATGPRIAPVESLRAIAALCVLGFHAAFISGLARSESALVPYVSRLEVGVSIFFLISGFLLYRPFARAALDDDARPSFRRYATSRVLRIVPAYWVALAAIALWLGLSEIWTGRGPITYFGFLQTYSPATYDGGLLQAWSLGVEVCFYAMLPAYAALLALLPAADGRARLRNQWLGLGALVVVGIAWNVIALSRLDPTTDAAQPFLLSLPAYLDQFALGMGLAVVVVAAERNERVASFAHAARHRTWVPLMLAGLAFWCASTQVGLEGGPERITDTQWLARHVLFSIVALGLLVSGVMAVPGNRDVGALYRWRPLRWIGLVSYGVFLWHLAVLMQLSRWDFSPPGGAVAGWLIWLAVAAGPVLVLAAVSWYGVERPALGLRDRLAASRRRRRRAASGEPEDLAAP